MDVWSIYSFAISGARTDAAGHAQVSWPALSGTGVVSLNAGGSASMMSGGMTIHYQLQYTEDLVTWHNVTTQGTVAYEPATRQFRFSDTSATATTPRFYRYMVWWE